MMQATRPSWTIVAHGWPTAAAGISFTGLRSIRRRFDRKALSRKAGHMAAKFKNEHFKDGGLLFGVFNPKRYIIAVFETAEEAEAAVAGLTKAGCEARHATPQEVRERAHEYLHQHGLTQHLGAAIAVDEKAAMQEYIALAEQGRHFVDVYVPDESEVGQVEAILEAHGAFDMQYYGDWDLVDLSSNEPTS